MADILHRIGVERSSPEQVYEALTTLDGLSGWWTEKTAGETDLDGVIEFRFGPGGFDMKVIALDPGRHVRWEVVDGPPEWIGTTVRWDLRRDGDWTIVLFAHEGWREPVEFMHHCSTKWAVYLLSLKQLLETGQGAPDPRDVRVSDWH
ncbi:SRPBCC domain-containing protein [Micromonospora sp. PLK6-60]|uniref:SRPBCC family protein n=1 Tax=Micromonospora sp. PLK6-60 TaxID=2873383 RepID=UPI001CA71EEE|nr:SRPBCC domain-containing protein [Micromonospora sp. PLK6-60]MBY8870582.1 SRPBCC domain-containing protein [Micromonospora sp. PLK6-60]